MPLPYGSKHELLREMYMRRRVGLCLYGKTTSLAKQLRALGAIRDVVHGCWLLPSRAVAKQLDLTWDNSLHGYFYNPQETDHDKAQ